MVAGDPYRFTEIPGAEQMQIKSTNTSFIFGDINRGCQRN